MNKSTKELVEKYPECEKLAKVSKLSNGIGEFLDWLREDKNIDLFQWTDKDDNGKPKFVNETGDPTIPSHYSFDEKEDSDFLNPEYETFPEGYCRVYTPFQKLLAQYFDIDMNKVEKERRELLDELQKGINNLT